MCKRPNPARSLPGKRKQASNLPLPWADISTVSQPELQIYQTREMKQEEKGSKKKG